MPTFEVNAASDLKPRKLKQRDSEKTLQRLLERYPSLLGHLSQAKPRTIVWFWHFKHGPGDLWGFDDRGHLVIVEIKKALGGTQEKKAASQLRAASRKGRRFVLKDIQRRYESWKADHQADDFRDEFKRVTGRNLHLKCTKPYLYMVAGHYTRRGHARLSKHPYPCVIIFAVDASRGRTIVSTERIN